MTASPVVAARRSIPDRPAPTAVAKTRRVPGLDLLYTLVFAVAGLGVGIERLSDNSFFLHLQTGRLILDQGVPHADPYSYVARGTDWVAQSWLAEVVYAGLDRLAGPFAIRCLVAAVAVAVFVLTFRLALRLARDRLRAALLAVLALAPVFVLWSERPLVFGVLFLLVVIWVVEVPESWAGRHQGGVLVVVFWIWANVHGSFALGFAYLGLHVVGRWADGAPPWRGRERSLVGAAIVAFLACFVNPYGPALVAFPVELVTRGDALRDVIEWSSPDFHRLSGLVFLTWTVGFVTILAATRRRVATRDLVVALPFLVLGFWALRNIAVAPLVGLPVAARAMALPRVRSGGAVGRRFAITVVAVLAMLGSALVVRAASEPDFVFAGYPVRAMDAVEREGLLGRRLLTDDADAGYVLLRFGERQPVFMDDRFDMYPQSVIDDFMVVNAGSQGWRDVLRRHDVEVIVWGRDRVLAGLLRDDDGWRAVHRDADHTVFVRADVGT